MKTKTKKRTKTQTPRLMSWVKLDPNDVILQDLDKKYGYTKEMGEGPYIFFGDIPNMQGHCVVMNRKGKFTVGMHTDIFVELTSEET